MLRLRQIGACLILGYFAMRQARELLICWHPAQWAAVVLLIAGLWGVARRLFWGRLVGVAIGGALLAKIGLELAYAPGSLLSWGIYRALVAPLGLVLLLLGRAMRGCYEGRPGRFNRWTEPLPRKEWALRGLILTNGIVAGLLCNEQVPLFATDKLLLGGFATLGLFGLVLQKTWGLLPALASAGVGLVTATYSALDVLSLPNGALEEAIRREWLAFCLVSGALATLSLMLLAPFWREAYRYLRGEACRPRTCLAPWLWAGLTAVLLATATWGNRELDNRMYLAPLLRAAATADRITLLTRFAREDGSSTRVEIRGREPVDQLLRVLEINGRWHGISCFCIGGDMIYFFRGERALLALNLLGSGSLYWKARARDGEPTTRKWTGELVTRRSARALSRFLAAHRPKQ